MQKTLKENLNRIMRKASTALAAGVAGFKHKPGRTTWEVDELCLTIIIPAFNSEIYIGRLLESIFGQSNLQLDFEIIIIDDGSVDNTAQIVQEWRRRYPDKIIYRKQENGGPSDARNHGISLARGNWLAFPDSDDFLDEYYFEEMIEALSKCKKDSTVAVCSNLHFYVEELEEFRNNHPMKYRFANGDQERTGSDLGELMQLSVNSAWVRASAVTESNIRFDTRIVPAFEDSNFINRVFLSRPRDTVYFAARPIYYYRKRSDKSSIIDGVKEDKSWYLDQVKFGYLGLLCSAYESYGYVPRYIQRTVLYSLAWKIKDVVGHQHRSPLSRDEKLEFLELCRGVFHYIDHETIKTFGLAGLNFIHKFGILSLFKGMEPENLRLRLMGTDSSGTGAQFAFVNSAAGQDFPEIKVNGVSVEPKLSRKIELDFFGIPFSKEVLFWINAGQNAAISGSYDDREIGVWRDGRRIGSAVSVNDLAVTLSPSPRRARDPETLRLRQLIRESVHKYSGCHLIMDRIDNADDNGEHLYRYLKDQGEVEKVWFVLSRQSPDWDRLVNEGFKILPYGSDQHIAALFNASWLFFSHIDEATLWPVRKNDFIDVKKYELIFLQHGVLAGDLSNWLNSKDVRFLVTSATFEAEAIVSPARRYKFSDREVVLTGMPRHDSLLRNASKSPDDSVLIIPTWRKSLLIQEGRERHLRDDFEATEYFACWQKLLNSRELLEFCSAEKLRIVFAPHPLVAAGFAGMEQAPGVEFVNMSAGGAYQELLARARLAVTDFSSAALDVAFLQRPVVYYQFDISEVKEGAHTNSFESFNFVDDGFGAVAATVDEAVRAVITALNGGEDPQYAQRRNVSFPLRDGHACRRVADLPNVLRQQSSGCPTRE